MSVGILPWTEKNLNLSDGVQNFVNLTAGPLVADGTVASKYLLVSPSSKDTISHDILLVGGSKLVGDKLTEGMGDRMEDSGK